MNRSFVRSISCHVAVRETFCVSDTFMSSPQHAHAHNSISKQVWPVQCKIKKSVNLQHNDRWQTDVNIGHNDMFFNMCQIWVCYTNSYYCLVRMKNEWRLEMIPVKRKITKLVKSRSGIIEAN